MQSREVVKTLKVISSFEDVIQTVAESDLEVSTACRVGANSVEAWGIVMTEFNDVITALMGARNDKDRTYRAAFVKALEIVMKANNYRREKDL